MPVYIALLRGINVSGQKKIKMEALREMTGALGFERVQSYIQSGNLIFHAPAGAPRALAQSIRRGIAGTFGFEVPVIVITGAVLREMMDANPFAPESHDEKRIYISYLERPVDNSRESLLHKYMTPEERIVLQENRLWFYCPGGYGKTRLNNNTVERALGVKVTTRNLKTSMTLCRMATADSP